jgi:hypothetical protein
MSKGQKKWEEILALGLDETKWREIFKLPFIVTQNTKLQWLQYRINQRILGKIYCFICNKMRLIASPRDDFEVSPKRKNCIVNGIRTPFDNNQESISSIKACTVGGNFSLRFR